MAQSTTAPQDTSLELPLELSWTAPRECPSVERVRAVLQRIVRPRAGRTLPALRVDAIVRRLGPRYRVLLVMARGEDTTQREFQSDDCEGLVRAVTLSIALLFGDGAELVDESSATTDRGLEPSVSDEPSHPAASVAPRSIAPPPDPAAERDSGRASKRHAERTIALGVGAAWSPRWVAEHTFGLQTTLSLRLSRVTFSWLSRAWAPATLHATNDARARFWSASTSIAAGARQTLGAFELKLGVALQAGLIHGAGTGIRAPAESFAPWYALVPSVALSVGSGRGFRVELSEEVSVALARPRFEITPVGEVYRVPAVTLITALGVPLDVTTF